MPSDIQGKMSSTGWTYKSGVLEGEDVGWGQYLCGSNMFRAYISFHTMLLGIYSDDFSGGQFGITSNIKVLIPFGQVIFNSVISDSKVLSVYYTNILCKMKFISSDLVKLYFHIVGPLHLFKKHTHTTEKPFLCELL